MRGHHYYILNLFDLFDIHGLYGHSLVQENSYPGEHKIYNFGKRFMVIFTLYLVNLIHDY